MTSAGDGRQISFPSAPEWDLFSESIVHVDLVVANLGSVGLDGDILKVGIHVGGRLRDEGAAPLHHLCCSRAPLEHRLLQVGLVRFLFKQRAEVPVEGCRDESREELSKA